MTYRNQEATAAAAVEWAEHIMRVVSAAFDGSRSHSGLLPKHKLFQTVFDEPMSVNRVELRFQVLPRRV